MRLGRAKLMCGLYSMEKFLEMSAGSTARGLWSMEKFLETLATLASLRPMTVQTMKVAMRAAVAAVLSIVLEPMVQGLPEVGDAYVHPKWIKRLDLP